MNDYVFGIDVAAPGSRDKSVVAVTNLDGTLLFSVPPRGERVLKYEFLDLAEIAAADLERKRQRDLLLAVVGVLLIVAGIFAVALGLTS